MVWYSLMPFFHQIPSIDGLIFTDAIFPSNPINWWFDIHWCRFTIKYHHLMVWYSLMLIFHQIPSIHGLIFTDANFPSNTINWWFNIRWCQFSIKYHQLMVWYLVIPISHQFLSIGSWAFVTHLYSSHHYQWIDETAQIDPQLVSFIPWENDRFSIKTDGKTMSNDRFPINRIAWVKKLKYTHFLAHILCLNFHGTMTFLPINGIIILEILLNVKFQFWLYLHIRI